MRGMLSLVFPVRCAVCRHPTTSGAALCAVCSCRLDQPLEREVEQSIAEHCDGTLVDGIFALWVFEKSGAIQQIHRAIKYGNQPFLGGAIGQLIADEAIRRGWTIDVVVPVPLHRMRRVSRGYNQVGQMAAGAANRLGARYYPNALTRSRATMTQTRLTEYDRAKNVAGVLQPTDHSLSGARVMIIDDVITSGATMTEAAAVARAAGAISVKACAMGFARR